MVVMKVDMRYKWMWLLWVQMVVCLMDDEMVESQGESKRKMGGGEGGMEWGGG